MVTCTVCNVFLDKVLHTVQYFGRDFSDRTEHNFAAGFYHICSVFSQESPFSDYEVGEQKLGEVKLVCWMPVESMKIDVLKVAMSY